MVHLLYFKQRMSLEGILEALTRKLLATNFIGKALSWFSQLPEGLIRSFESFGKNVLEQYHSNHPQYMSMVDLHIE